jgi:hypothetical protein
LFLGKRPPIRHSPRVTPAWKITVALLLAVTTARALTIVGYDAATNDRFASGYPLSPVENVSASFLGSGYDLSGVGWNPANTSQSFAMISDEFFVYSTHYSPGSQISFYSAAQGSVVTYGVDATTYHFTYNGEISDFAIGRLSSALNPADGIAAYEILDLSTIESYLGLPVLLYGHGANGPRLGANVIDAYADYNFPNGGTTSDSYGIGYSYVSGQNGESKFESGDSGSPTFVPWNGRLALLGTHSVIGTLGDVEYSIDNFIPIYLDQMTTQGIEFAVVPEPSRFVLLLTGACALLRRRHRARRE